MTKLSNNFSRSEFKCNCGECDYDTVDAELVKVLQDVRDAYNAPVKITSGNRCPDYNREVGGADKSYHVRGRAADIQVKGIAPDEIAQYLDWKYPDKFGIGNYKTFTHIDTRSGKGRWKG